MNRENIIVLANLLGSKYRQTEFDVMLSCPFAQYSEAHSFSYDKKPSFGVKLSATQSVCHCFACGVKGSLSFIFYRLFKQKCISKEIYDFVIAQEKGDFFGQLNSSSILAMPAPRIESSEVKTIDFSFFISDRGGDFYFRHRRLTDVEIRKFNLGYDWKKTRVFFPFVSQSLNVVGGIGRTIGDMQPKYYVYPSSDNSYFFGEQFIDSTLNSVILVEGALDVIMASRCFSNVLGICTDLTKVKLERLLHFGRSICIMLDNDAAGRAKTNKIARIIYRRIPKVNIICLPEGKDPADCTIEEMRIAFAAKQVYSTGYTI